MPSFGFGIPKKGTLREALDETPKRIRTYVKTGFSNLAKLDEALWPVLVSLIETSGAQPAGVEFEQVAKKLNVPLEDIGEIVGAARLLCGVLAFRSESPTEFVEAAEALDCLDKADVLRIRQLGEFVAKNREDLKQEFEQRSLQNDILPSLVEFDTRIDLRLHFEDNKVSYLVPVALVHIETDVEDGDLWLQMSPFQLESLLSSLQQTLTQLKEAELIAKKPV